MGRGEYELVSFIPILHSPLPAPHFTSRWPNRRSTPWLKTRNCRPLWAAAPLILVLAARADFVEKPDTLLGIIQNLLKRVAGRRVAVLIAYLDRGALPFG